MVELEFGRFGAWLFDLDGVLTDTAGVHAAAWKAAFDRVLEEESARTGAPYVPFDRNDDYLRYVDGRPRAEGVRTFLASRGIHLEDGRPDDPPTTRTVAGVSNWKNELFQQELETSGVTVFPGSRAFVEYLRSRGVRTAVVSASENTRAVVDAGGIAGLFDVCVDGLVARRMHLAGKPAPDTYVEAARMLEVPPTRSVVVEDALVGVEAGREGGFALVVGVDRVGQAAALTAHGADVVVDDLSTLIP